MSRHTLTWILVLVSGVMVVVFLRMVRSAHRGDYDVLSMATLHAMPWEFGVWAAFVVVAVVSLIVESRNSK